MGNTIIRENERVNRYCNENWDKLFTTKIQILSWKKKLDEIQFKNCDDEKSPNFSKKRDIEAEINNLEKLYRELSEINEFCASNSR